MAGRITFQGAVGTDPGRAYTPFETRQINSQNVSLAANRLMGGSQPRSGYNASLSDGLFFQDVQTRSLGFWCDSTFYARANKCTSEQHDTILQYRSSNSDSVVRARYINQIAKAKADAAKAIADKPAAEYAAYVVGTATPEMKEEIRKEMIRKGILHPLETTWNSSAASQLRNFYSGPLTLGSSGAAAAQKAAFDAQAAANLAEAGKDTRVVSYDSADMRAATLQRRALSNQKPLSEYEDELKLRDSNGAKSESYTTEEFNQAALNAVAESRLLSLRKENFAASDELAKAVKVQSDNLRGLGGLTPVATPKPSRPASRKPLPKPKGRRR